MTKDQIFNELLGKEGGYVSHPSDRGGPTKWGITEKVARAHGFSGSMQDLTRERALIIYEADYWYGPRFDQVAALSPDIAAELCDTGVNMGPGVASQFLQRWLNVMNQRGALYPDLIADGLIGPRTINALRAYVDNRNKAGIVVMLRGLNCCQGARYLDITESREANEDFIFGWLLNRVTMPGYIKQDVGG